MKESTCKHKWEYQESIIQRTYFATGGIEREFLYTIIFCPKCGEVEKRNV